MNINQDNYHPAHPEILKILIQTFSLLIIIVKQNPPPACNDQNNSAPRG